MSLRPTALLALVCFLMPLTGRSLSAAAPPAACRRAVLEGELHAGQPFMQALGGGLKVYFQPIQSGWILRIVPVSGPSPAHDYAELATPPYDSVTPLSLSTDFSFRAQDAIGWNPRRFRFATSAASFQALERAYEQFESAEGPRTAGGQGAGRPVPPAIQAELASQIARSSEGTLTILDSRLIPGTADQWRMAAAVASHFATTAHTVVQEPDGTSTPLGRLLWVRFRLELNLPEGFTAKSGLHLVPRICDVP